MEAYFPAAGGGLEMIMGQCQPVIGADAMVCVAWFVISFPF